MSDSPCRALDLARAILVAPGDVVLREDDKILVATALSVAAIADSLHFASRALAESPEMRHRPYEVIARYAAATEDARRHHDTEILRFRAENERPARS